MAYFEKLKVPESWQSYWTRYPEGYTILEALIEWVSQVDRLTTNINDWNKYLDEFVKMFDKNLQDKVTTILKEWMADGTLENIINEAIVIANKNLEYRGINVMYPPAPYKGATGDGTTDDYEAIQALLTNFKHLYFPSGKTFYVSKALVPSTSTIIEGEGTIKGQAGLRFAMTVKGASLFINRGVGFTLSGLQVLQSSNVEVTGGSYTNILDRPAIEFAGVQDFKLNENTIKDVRMGIHVINSKNGTVSQNLVENIGGGRSNGVNETALGQIAILLWGNSDNENGSEKAVYNVAVTGNVCRNGSDNGIRLIAEKYHIANGDNTGRCYDCSVTGNVVEGFYIDGIRVTCDNTVVTGNTVRNCTYGGIRGNGCIDLSIVANHVEGDTTSRFGINMGLVHEHSSGKNLVIANNVVKKTQNGISVFGGKRPTTQEETTMYNTTITDNQVYECREVGVTLYKCNGAMVANNIVKDNGATGIDCTGENMSIINNMIDGNVSENHQTYKYGLQATVDNATIAGNRISNQKNGVGFVQKGNQVLEYGNVFQGNTTNADIWTNKDYIPLDVFGSTRVGTKPSVNNQKDGDMYFDGNALRLRVNGEWKFIPLSNSLTTI